MHEWGFCEGILEAVRRRAAGRRVKRIKVRVGVLHRLEPEAMQQGFSIAAAGSEAEDAILDMSIIPAKSRCRLCLNESEATEIAVLCSNCGGAVIEISGGDDLTLESLEYETVVKPNAE
jgi:hydrogenase nickel incorporation protein HypA/HybF